MRELEEGGSLGPVTRIARTRGATLGEAAKGAEQAARRWWHEGYDVESVLVSLKLRRCDDFRE